MGKIIDGRAVAQEVKNQVKEFVNKKVNEGKRVPKIASILVGNDGGSIYYINSQEKVALSLGLLFDKILLDENIKEEELIKLIDKLNNDDTVDGIMIQVPLPKHINEKKVVESISPLKDIDCLTTESVGKLYTGEKGFIPCTPNSVMHLIKSLGVDIKGKEAVVLGRSNIVGKPVSQLLLNENATVTICHSKTKDL